MEISWWPPRISHIRESGLIRESDLVTSEVDTRFHIGQSYDDEVARTFSCRLCGGAEFFVGRGSYFTAIKCCQCQWEWAIHTG